VLVWSSVFACLIGRKLRIDARREDLPTRVSVASTPPDVESTFEMRPIRASTSGLTKENEVFGGCVAFSADILKRC